jgi:hypothetical protein
MRAHEVITLTPMDGVHGRGSFSPSSSSCEASHLSQDCSLDATPHTPLHHAAGTNVVGCRTCHVRTNACASANQWGPDQRGKLGSWMFFVCGEAPPCHGVRVAGRLMSTHTWYPRLAHGQRSTDSSRLFSRGPGAESQVWLPPCTLGHVVGDRLAWYKPRTERVHSGGAADTAWTSRSPPRRTRRGRCATGTTSRAERQPPPRVHALALCVLPPRRLVRPARCGRARTTTARRRSTVGHAHGVIVVHSANGRWAHLQPPGSSTRPHLILHQRRA